VVNLSLNETLMRSVNTSLVVLLPIACLLLFGGDTLKDFAFALFIGVAAGAYSSIFIASPMLALLKEREPRYQQMRLRAARAAGRSQTRPATVGGGGAASLKPVEQRSARPSSSPKKSPPPVAAADAAGDGNGQAAPAGGTPPSTTGAAAGSGSSARPSGARPGGSRSKSKKRPPPAKRKRR
jgi:hypothetical protein